MKPCEHDFYMYMYLHLRVDLTGFIHDPLALQSFLMLGTNPNMYNMYKLSLRYTYMEHVTDQLRPVGSLPLAQNA